jgi:hypothetical protein
LGVLYHRPSQTHLMLGRGRLTGQHEGGTHEGNYQYSHYPAHCRHIAPLSFLIRWSKTFRLDSTNMTDQPISLTHTSFWFSDE